MRYIGNKTRLLPFILRTIEQLGIRRGRAHDAFAGTSAVGRALKGAGWRVTSSDIMTYSYVFQRAYVVASRVPSLARLTSADTEFRRAMRSPALRERVRSRVNGDGGPLRRDLVRLATLGEYLGAWLEPESGFVAAHFAPSGGRMFFTAENARRIDAVRRALYEWGSAGAVDDDTYYLLLAALLEGADRVANTAGVYAAYIKSWQPNARRALTILPERPLPGKGSTAHRADAVAVAREAGELELLYIDPPYNARQYAGYYHVPEIVARGWFDGAPPMLRGKTGLVHDPASRSAWCSGRRVRGALEELLAATGARDVLVSYNSEGLLPAAGLREALQLVSIDGQVRCFSQPYRRYRADSDRVGRRYKGDHVRELLYHARLR